MNAKSLRTAVRSTGNDAHAAVADDDRHAALDFGHRNAAGRSAVGARALCDRRRRRSPFPDRRLRSTGRPGGLRFADWSCCKSLRETRRPCRPRPAGSLASSSARRRGRRSGRGCRCIRSSLGGRTSTTRVAGIVPRLADRDVLDAKRAAAGRDRVEHLRQNEAVDDMAGDFDLFDDGIFGGHGLVFAGGVGCSRLFVMPWKPYTWVVFTNRQGQRRSAAQRAQQ